MVIATLCPEISYEQVLVKVGRLRMNRPPNRRWFLVVFIPLWIIMIAAALFGFALGVAQPLSMSWLASITPNHNRGVSASLRLAVNRVAQVGTPLVLGSLVAVTGTWAVIAASGVMISRDSRGGEEDAAFWRARVRPNGPEGKMLDAGARHM